MKSSKSINNKNESSVTAADGTLTGHGQKHKVSRPGKSSKDRKMIKGQLPDVISALIDWNISFKGDKGLLAERFLSDLKNCQEYYDFSDDEFLPALSRVFKGSICAMQLETHKSEWNSFARFESDFCSHYCKKLDREDIYDALRERTQGDEGSISDFVTAFRYIASRMNPQTPLIERLALIKKNFQKDFQKFIRGKTVGDFRCLLEFGEKRAGDS